MFEGYFLPSNIAILQTTKEFMPIKLGCSIYGRIKHMLVQIRNLKILGFETADHRLLHISC